MLQPMTKEEQRELARQGAETTENNRVSDTVELYFWYAIVCIVSLLCLVFLPMFGSEMPLAWNLPNNPIGWIVYIGTKLMVAALNMLIFHSFVQQGDVNVKFYWKRMIGDEILSRIKTISYNPLSPEEWKRREYRHKLVWVVITSLASAFCLGQAIISFSWSSFLSYFITIFLGFLFGVLQMKRTEGYWSKEYYDYALVSLEKYNATVAFEEKIFINRSKKQLIQNKKVIFDYYNEKINDRDDIYYIEGENNDKE